MINTYTYTQILRYCVNLLYSKRINLIWWKKFTMIEINRINHVCLVAQSVKNPPAMQETRLRSLGQEDPLEKEMATHPSILAWRIPWTEEPGRLHSVGSQRVGHN